MTTRFLFLINIFLSLSFFKWLLFPFFSNAISLSFNVFVSLITNSQCHHHQISLKHEFFRSSQRKRRLSQSVSHTLPHLLKLVAKKKSWVSDKHLLSVKILHFNLLLPHQSQRRPLLLLNYLTKRVLEVNAAVKRLCTERKLPQLVNEALTPCKWNFRRECPVSTCNSSLQVH